MIGENSPAVVRCDCSIESFGSFAESFGSFAPLGFFKANIC